jgi:hypothetical protein
MAALHVHADAVPEPVQAWWVPHVAAVVHCVQPFDCVIQAWTAPFPGMHCFAPATHSSVQGAASPPASPGAARSGMAPPSGIEPSCATVASAPSLPASPAPPPLLPLAAPLLLAPELPDGVASPPLAPPLEAMDDESPASYG